MAEYVLLTDIVAAMADYAPPAWNKLAILGALHTDRVQLFSGTGSFKSYLPPYYFSDPDSSFRSRISRVHTSEDDVIRNYELGEIERPNQEEIILWEEEWNGTPRAISLGWLMFVEPWNWDAPAVRYEAFEVPRDYEGLFGYDDLHPEGEPDLAVYYDANFSDLALSLDGAESIIPMGRFDNKTFGSEIPNPTRRVGRTLKSGYHSADEPLVQKMMADLRKNSSLSHRSLAEKYVEEAAGHGIRESKVKRLERRLRAAL